MILTLSEVQWEYAMDAVYKRIANSSDGFVLPYVLLVTILITTLLLSLLGLISLNNKLTTKRLNKTKLDLACYSIVQKMISDTSNIKYGHYSYKFDSAIVSVNYYREGLFDIIETKSHSHNDSSMFRCSIGYALPSTFKYAIIQLRPNLHLSVAGYTNINGDIEVSTPRIDFGNVFGLKAAKKGFLNGQMDFKDSIGSYNYPNELTNSVFDFNLSALGNIKPISRQITLNESTITDSGLNDTLIINGNLIISGNLDSQKQKSKKVYVVRGNTIFADMTTSNMNLQIYCDSLITIQSQSTLRNALLVAKGNIYVGNNVKLKNAQLYSEGNISIYNSQILYPAVAAISVKAEDPSSLNHNISLHNSTFNGTLMLLSNVKGLQANKSKIYTDEGTTVQGYIYSENNVELRGKLYGVVNTYNFRYYKSPNEYLNWLINLRIDRTKLDKWFLLPNGFADKKYSEILSQLWVY